ncbi:MAG: phosphotransferase [Gammaproteobacteria bacterium]|nr:phosphotransferase [Gammaproteobacteria bacterium]
MSDNRQGELENWLRGLPKFESFEIVLASGDASFRRYFRITRASDGQSFIAMDAPPDKEDCHPFVDIAQAMRQMGLNTPEIFEQDLTQGFLLLSDFGDEQYQAHLNTESVERLYGDALDALFCLQTEWPKVATTIPDYDHPLLMREMKLFPEWFLGQHLQVQLSTQETEQLQSVFEALAQSALAQPQVWVHRDYHSRNLMLVEKNNPGVLDFQDAVVGAVTYDLVSLLRDCYIAWPIEQVEQWVKQYRQRLSDAGWSLGDDKRFLRDFDLMGVQRHLKAIGIFARLNHRDGKTGYLADIPRTLTYVQTVCEKYSELKFLNSLISEKVLPVFNQTNGQRL